MKRIQILLPAIASAAALMGCGETEPAKPEKLTAKTWEPEDAELKRGKEIYLNTCSLCHDEGEEGAPRLRVESEWAPRREKGIDTLIKHATEGFTGLVGEMPARGGEDSYSDEDVAAAVRFMFEASQL